MRLLQTVPSREREINLKGEIAAAHSEPRNDTKKDEILKQACPELD
jgi:hypothetical protein